MVEVEHLIAKERTVDQKPFVIRGHHLALYAQLVRKKTIDQDASSRLAKRIRDDMRYSKAGYARDVLGSWDQIDKHEERLKIAFETFLQLPDNHPTEIVEGIPDIICDGCAIGEHCRSFTKGSLGQGVFKRDGKHIGSFLKNLDGLNLPKPTIIQEQAHFSDAQPQQARRIRTTTGVVKKVLKEGKGFSLLSIILRDNL